MTSFFFLFLNSNLNLASYNITTKVWRAKYFTDAGERQHKWVAVMGEMCECKETVARDSLGLRISTLSILHYSERMESKNKLKMHC